VQRPLVEVEMGQTIAIWIGEKAYLCTVFETVEVRKARDWIRVGLPNLQEGERLVIARLGEQT
jgi:hypothetical protein